MRIALISCTKLKQDYRCRAEEMYKPSTLFQKALAYVKDQGYDEIFILSALHGLISLDKPIDPYDKTLNNAPSLEIKVWSASTSASIIAQQPTEVDFYAGEKYRKYLIPILEASEIKCNVPLKGLGIGDQLGYYKQRGY